MIMSFIGKIMYNDVGIVVDEDSGLVCFVGAAHASGPLDYLI